MGLEEAAERGEVTEEATEGGLSGEGAERGEVMKEDVIEKLNLLFEERKTNISCCRLGDNLV